MGTIAKLSESLIHLEMLRPSLNEIGADLLDRHGQIIFPILDRDGSVSKGVVYVGPLNAMSNFGPNWEPVEVPNNSEGFPSFIEKIREVAKERAWLR